MKKLFIIRTKNGSEYPVYRRKGHWYLVKEGKKALIVGIGGLDATKVEHFDAALGKKLTFVFHKDEIWGTSEIVEVNEVSRAA